MSFWERLKARKRLIKAFEAGELYLTYKTSDGNERKIYPKIHSVQPNKYRFSLPTGLDPKQIKRKEYCFQQVFGNGIELKGDNKHFTLEVFSSVIPSILKYDYELYFPQFEKMSLPIVAGLDLNGNLIVFDMVKNPHLLIAGETGSGKSTQLRSVITSLIKAIPSEQLKLFLCDLKRSEFHLFRNIEHVEGVFNSAKEMLPMLLLELKAELERRGDLLDHNEVAHIDDLPNPPHYIVLAIDEVALLKSEKKLMGIVEDISAIGRALGVFLILSMQRPDRDVLDGKLKNNLTVRMGFRCADLTNSRIVGTPGSEKLEKDGRMLLKIPLFRELKEIQAPYLSLERAKGLLEGYKSRKKENAYLSDSNALKTIENEIFEVLDP